MPQGDKKDDVEEEDDFCAQTVMDAAKPGTILKVRIFHVFRS